MDPASEPRRGRCWSLRETSIVFGAVIGTVFFGERFGVGRVVASAVVALGIVLVNL